MSQIKEFLSSAYGMIAAAAGVAATLWGLIKAIGALKKWIKTKWYQHKDKAAMPQRTYALIEELKLQQHRTNEKLETISQRMNDNDEATATLMLEKMMGAYHKYVLQKEDIPLDTKTAMCVMFEQYKKNPKHNHVPADFIDRINECKVLGEK